VLLRLGVVHELVVHEAGMYLSWFPGKLIDSMCQLAICQTPAPQRCRHASLRI
jgi:hypothetical protein